MHVPGMVTSKRRTRCAIRPSRSCVWRNEIGVVSGTADCVDSWRKAAPDHLIPGFLFELSQKADTPERAEFYRYLQRVIDAGFGKRVMFGSDQTLWPGMIEYAA